MPDPTIHELVLSGARIIDPETATDTVADVAVSGGRITAVSSEALIGRTTLDVSGKVVAPGFVDLHSHGQAIPEQRLQALDGVTTALELEAGALGIEAAYSRAAAEGRPINYGWSASWALARMTVLGGTRRDGSLAEFLAHIAEPAWQRPASAPELEAIAELLRTELACGALGIGVLVGYAPSVDAEEYLAVARVAAEAQVPTYTHARDLVENDPATVVDGAGEIVRAAAETGAHMHYCHVNSTSGRHVERVLRLIGEVSSAGSGVSAEAYPYGTGMTGVGAGFLAPELLARRDLTPGSIRPAATGRPFADAEELAEARRRDPGALVFVDLLDDADPAQFRLVEEALGAPGTVVASDAVPITWSGAAPDPLTWPLPPGGITHPRSVGTFARTLRLARERQLMSLPEVIRRCSYLPACILERAAPAMAQKGRLKVGCDADLVVLDPQAVGEAASFTDTLAPSKGIAHVLVGGVFVVRDGDLVADAMPGKPVRAAARR